MSIFSPEDVKSKGAVKVKILTTAPTNPAAASLATDVDAASAVDVSLTFHDWNPTQQINTGNSPARLGTTDQFPQEGLAVYQPVPVTYPYDPQADDTDPNNQGKKALPQGGIVWALVRKGLDAETDFAVGDMYELWKVSCGKQVPGRSGDDEFAVFQIAQNLYPMEKETAGTIAA